MIFRPPGHPHFSKRNAACSSEKARQGIALDAAAAVGADRDALADRGRHADKGDVVREALRVLERKEFDESPAPEAAILEGVAAPHRPYDPSVMDRIRRNARSLA